MASSTRMVKVILLGDGSVGKSSLMQQFVRNEFNSESFHTIGVEVLNKDVRVGSEAITMQIWDTAGQERFRSLRTPFYRGADCCMLTFDLTDPNSFNNINMWRDEFLKHASVDDVAAFPFLLLGNKADLAEQRQVTAEAARAWCRENGNVPYYETSAKTGSNVEDAFQQAARMLLQHGTQAAPDFDDTVDLKKQRRESSSCC
ncbi:small GTP binding protein Rab9 [Salpingoeca rosetta]|uniref:small monomeric GTPase n=1 Tax=Salpingoeca rosetta (strain ATCC 50818 / BSB-021) TaxID=946362 RepID=F2U570_SALR5|nr:small GTP binding protein Rab9 [Salpingoeca rosetta]EGD82786.1 small GTP binding protein Rab9 [Salpingoeca rosetta]|eukprot:XP_004996022.1 small GTP binding protein Rab9 [Salpingoeca rosetta]